MRHPRGPGARQCARPCGKWQSARTRRTRDWPSTSCTTRSTTRESSAAASTPAPPARPPPMVSPPDSPKPKFQQPPLPPPPPPPRRSLELMPCHRDARRSTSRTNGSPPRPGTALASSDKEWTSLLKQPAYSREAMRGVDRLPPPRPRSSAPVLGRWTAQVLREQVRADLLPAGCCYCKPFLLTVVYYPARSACLPGAPGSKAMALHGMAVHGAGSAPGGQPCPTRPRHAASPSRWRERRAPNALRRHAECEGHFRAEEGLTQTHAPMPSILWKAHKRKHGLIGSHRPQLYSLGYCKKKNSFFFGKVSSEFRVSRFRGTSFLLEYSMACRTASRSAVASSSSATELVSLARWPGALVALGSMWRL